MNRILAIDPTSRGFGFAVLEDRPLRLLDWGVVEHRRNKNIGAPSRLLRLIREYQPTVIVTEKCRVRHASRCRTTHPFVDLIALLVEEVPIPIVTCSREQVRRAFSRHGAVTKEEIARVISEVFPELKPRLPKRREIWQSEDYRISIFDAVALGMTFVANEGSLESVGA